MTTENYKHGEIFKVNISDLYTGANVREVEDDDDMKYLVENIKKYGLINPIIVRSPKEGEVVDDKPLVIVGGHRRHKAFEKAGEKTISAIWVENGSKLMALMDNESHVSSPPMRLAFELKAIMDENDDFNQKTLAAALGRAESTVSEILKLNNLHKTIQTAVMNDSSWTRAALLDIEKIKDPKKQLATYNRKKKALAGGQKAPVGHPIRQITTAANSLKKQIKNLSSLGNSSAEDREKLQVALSELKAGISEFEEKHLKNLES